MEILSHPLMSACDEHHRKHSRMQEDGSLTPRGHGETIPRYPGEGNRKERRKQTALERKRYGWSSLSRV